MCGCVQGGPSSGLLASWKIAEMRDENGANRQRRRRLAGCGKVDRVWVFGNVKVLVIIVSCEMAHRASPSGSPRGHYFWPALYSCRRPLTILEYWYLPHRISHLAHNSMLHMLGLGHVKLVDETTWPLGPITYCSQRLLDRAHGAFGNLVYQTARPEQQPINSQLHTNETPRDRLLVRQEVHLDAFKKLRSRAVRLSSFDNSKGEYNSRRGRL